MTERLFDIVVATYAWGMIKVSLMSRYIDVRDPPPNRKRFCEDGKECHFTEGAIMIAFAMHLFEKGASAVEIHPDGEHGKRHDVRGSLIAHGFKHDSGHGRTTYAGVYSRGDQTLTVTINPGVGDVVARLGEQVLVAECKGGVLNSSHPGQQSRLRRGLCEAVGLLIARPLDGERQVAVVPATLAARAVGGRMLDRAMAANIEIALVSGQGEVEYLAPVG